MAYKALALDYIDDVPGFASSAKDLEIMGFRIRLDSLDALTPAIRAEQESLIHCEHYTTLFLVRHIPFLPPPIK